MVRPSRYDAKRIVLATVRAEVQVDAATLTVEEATQRLEWFAELERLAVAGRTITAARVAGGGAWQREGARSPAEWLATRTRSTVAEARRALDTAARLGDAPATDAAFRRGELSAMQAEAVSIGAVGGPEDEARLLAMTRTHSLQKVREEAARVRAAHEPDPDERHGRIRRGRCWRRWTDPDGARCGSYRTTPEEAAQIEAAAQPFIDAALDDARRRGEHEPAEAYAVDGLVGLASASLRGEGSAPPKARGGRGRRRLRNRRELIGIVNLESLRRGSVDGGEMCEIAGVGPVPVSVARSLFGDAVLRVVIRNGVDIRTVVHTGHSATALQETAVLVRDGGRCIRPTCDQPACEIDHQLGFAIQRVTTLDDLGGLCGHDHDLKTRHGHTYRRLPDGSIEWIRPDGTVESERPPP